MVRSSPQWHKFPFLVMQSFLGYLSTPKHKYWACDEHLHLKPVWPLLTWPTRPFIFATGMFGSNLMISSLNPKLADRKKRSSLAGCAGIFSKLCIMPRGVTTTQITVMDLWQESGREEWCVPCSAQRFSCWVRKMLRWPELDQSQINCWMSTLSAALYLSLMFALWLC